MVAVLGGEREQKTKLKVKKTVFFDKECIITTPTHMYMGCMSMYLVEVSVTSK